MQHTDWIAMSETRRLDLGYPKSKVDSPTGYWFLICGGMGAGSCLLPIGFTQFVYAIKVPKFIVFNRSLLFMNDNAIDIGDDGGTSGFCDHSFGTRKPFWIAFSADGILTDAQVKSKGKMFNQAAYPAYNIFIQAKDLPQPSDASWQGKIYVHLVWDSPLYVNNGGTFVDNMLTLVKHDSDEKI